MGGQGGQLPIQFLADQLTLSQPEGVDCAPYITKYLPTQLLVASNVTHWNMAVLYKFILQKKISVGKIEMILIYLIGYEIL